MNGRQHEIIGSVCGIGTCIGIIVLGGTVYEGFAAIPLTLFGSILPDIDNENATISKCVPFLSKIFSKLGHRTYTHSILLWVLLGLISYFTLPLWVMGLFVGVASHLFLDAMTVNGIPLYCLGTKANKWNRHIHILPKFMRCKSGSVWSSILCALTVIIPLAVAFVI